MRIFVRLLTTLALSGLCFLTGAVLVLCLWYTPLQNHILSIKCMVNNCNITTDVCFEDICENLKCQQTAYPCNKICLSYTLPLKNISKEDCITVDNDDLTTWCDNRLVIECYVDDRNFNTLSLTDNWSVDKNKSYNIMLILFLLSSIAIGITISLITIECFIDRKVKDKIDMNSMRY